MVGPWIRWDDAGWDERQRCGGTGLGGMRSERANLASADGEDSRVERAVMRHRLGLASVGDRQSFTYVSIRLAHRACVVRIAICFALVSDANALWYDDSTNSVR